MLEISLWRSIRQNLSSWLTFLELPRYLSRIINEAGTELAALYPNMFKLSQCCQPPHLNTNNLRDALFMANILKKNGNIESPKDLPQWLEDHNAELGKKYKQVEGSAIRNSKRGVSDVAASKAIETECCIGLESTWLY